ncbi:MAG: hypothetical protein GX444_05825 [Myxococcales bacterium]|nr:hypothetical protein [Myxococcales bacterium]
MLIFKRNLNFHLSSKGLQRSFTILIILAVLGMIGIFALNYGLLQRPLNRVIGRDDRNLGVRATAYFDSYVDLDTIVFDVRGLDPRSGAQGLVRTFLEYAHELQGSDIDEVIIAYRGQRKLKIRGDDFLTLGASLGTAQPREVMWELAHNLRFLNGKMVMSNLPGNYAALLQKSLGDVQQTEDATANQILQTIQQ